MLRGLVPVLLLLVLAPTACADGPGLLSDVDGGTGVTSSSSAVRYVTIPAGGSTVLEAVRRSDGAVSAWRGLNGAWGIPAVTVGGVSGGLSDDGRVLVLGDSSPQLTPLRRVTRILVLGVPDLAVRRLIRLRGDFAFDALSPRGATLYLIQHVSERDATRYRVRAYDLRSGRLLPRVIADRRERGWTMSGYPVARATSAEGRWVFTLYRQADNYPFVHALDTVTRTAVCIAVPEPWRPMLRADANALYLGSLRLASGGTRLLLADRPGTAPRYVVDTRTFRVSAAAADGGPPLAPAGIGTVAALLLVGMVLVARRRA